MLIISQYVLKNIYSISGPFDTTVVEFWRMIWQEDSNRIVMVANIEESGKDDIRTVYHLHFTSWTDKRKPVYGATTLIAFYRNVQSFHEVAKGPLVVHCSAGIGRTGTFIALDILQKQTMHKGILNVYNCVKKLRGERMLMVQTEAQYHFIHMFMVEFIKCGFTSYDVNGFPNTFRLLCDPDPQLAGLSRLERQFQILCEMKDKLIDNQSKDGLSNYNRPKNRDLDVVPSKSYCNLKSVSFKVRDFYVVTQMPLPETITDFWRLVYKLKTRSIIMLNQFDNTDPTSKPYWPSKEIPNQSYGPIELTLVSTNNDNTTDSVYTRDFLIRSKNSKRTEGRTLRHFQLLTWPNSATVPPTKEDLFKLIDLNGQWQDQLKSKRAGNTIVHCLTGGRQSGVYCGITFLLDKMSSEQQIDGFLAARYVTRTRPQFFQTKEEFRFLHEVALAIIPKNKLYENIPQTL
ncbi:hypothetical protein LSH36_1334g00025 [Paralvinella palmiformis]|uniref:Uncharacterized protein n=1 Tax=Paralvinella palmiformis TaxID=53620 RepID=A0AAD9IT56_9ANNE|nr:hypothetical protein LSH36_1334g00025 [Paralvinella palmiformis]